jgi:hypothetical protein
MLLRLYLLVFEMGLELTWAHTGSRWCLIPAHLYVSLSKSLSPAAIQKAPSFDEAFCMAGYIG